MKINSRELKKLIRDTLIESKVVEFTMDEAAELLKEQQYKKKLRSLFDVGNWQQAIELGKLVGVDFLIGVDIRGSKLKGADLSGANFTEANLSGSDMRFVDLSSANLRNANLRGTNFYEGNFRDADLTDANLDYATLFGADLRGANLTGASLHMATLKGVKYDNDTIWPEGFPGRFGSTVFSPQKV